jgi:hypothetical protein
MWKATAGMLIGFISLGMQAGTASAHEPGESNSAIMPENLSGTTDPGTPGAGSASTAPAEGPSLSDVVQLLQEQGQEIESLRAALREQQELTAELKARLNSPPEESPATSAAAAPAVAADPSAAPQGDFEERLTRDEANAAASQRSFEDRLKSFGPFAFSGDFRLRAEPTFGGPTNLSQDRFRNRFRLRFNAEAKLNDQFWGGFSLASGDLNNPISTNQTAGQYDTRKPIAIDKAYLTYNPGWFRPLTLTGGKFAYPWFNTELVWDKDLNPEGTAETLAFKTDTSLLKRFAVVGFQLPFAENRRTATTDLSYYNTMVYGAQVQSVWQLGGRAKLSAYTGYYDWKYADSVALSLEVANSASPDDGLLPLNSTGEQNSIATITTTNAITGTKTITSAQFASKFDIFDTLAQVDITTPTERWPITFVGDFAQNTQACENMDNIPEAAVFSAPCDPHARHAYWLETRVGRTDRKGDWQFAYTRIMIEREAVLGAFNYSEIFPSSNVEIHRPEILYQLFQNVTLQLNGLIGRPLVTSSSPLQPLWERLQFDVIYKF